MRQRGLHSPDIADALALTFAIPVHAKAASGGVRQNTFAKDFKVWR